MGCDIHMYLEGKRTINDVKKWISLDYFKLNPYFEPNNEDREREYDIVPIYSDRNYCLFSVLAGVRDYSGITPISEPKGTPDDCCEIIKQAKEYWDGDGHSHSYLTLRELQEYASKNIKTKYSGYISPKASHELDAGIPPNCWCQGTSASDWVHREWEVEENLLEPIIAAMRKQAGEGLWLWDDKAIDEKADEIRIVFWFDN